MRFKIYKRTDQVRRIYIWGEGVQNVGNYTEYGIHIWEKYTETGVHIGGHI